MTDIESKVEELADEIEELDEYDRFEEAAEAYENDEEAQQLLLDIRRLENEIEVAHHKGEDHEEHEEKHEELEELYEELHSLDVVVEFNEAAEELGSELTQVNDILSRRMGGVNFADVLLKGE